MLDHFYETRAAASEAAAERIAAAIERRLGLQKTAGLVVSGGTTPVQCFAALSQAELDWGRVTVALSDERWVPADDDSSNERLVRSTLLADRAASAQLLPTYQADADATEGAGMLAEAIRSGPFPFACVLLGMGADGHFASLFPDAANLADGLDVDSTTLAIPVSTAASPHPRVSLTLAALSRSDEIVLLIFGDDKRAVYEQAKADADAYPVSQLLFQKRAPVHVYWAP